MRGRAGKVVDLVHLQIEREGDVVPDHLEVLVIQQVLDVAPGAGEEIVDADHDGSARQQALAEMRAEEA
jgi:hypothetical protein